LSTFAAAMAHAGSTPDLVLGFEERGGLPVATPERHTQPGF
jgi:hypothetical protein